MKEDNSSITYGNFFLNNNIIQNNRGGTGGGAKLTAKRISLENNSFLSNTAGLGGAIDIQDIAEEVTLLNNFISYNEADVAEGGAVHIKWLNAPVNFINNVISYNATTRYVCGGHGGGAHISTYGPVNFINNTVVGNTANPICCYGGGITIYYSSYASVYNNIFWNNNGQTGRDIVFVGVLDSNVAIYNNNLDQSSGGVSGLDDYIFDPTNLNAVDPLFLNLSANNLRLQVASACINSGDNNAPRVPLKDIDGNPRIVSVNVDMGAYEYQGTFVPTDPDLYGWLREFHYYRLVERVVTKIDVKNGGTSSGPFGISFYLSDNGSTLGEMICTGTVKRGLKANAVITQSCDYVGNVPLSEKYIIGVIDSYDQISEMAETNNRVKVRIP